MAFNCPECRTPIDVPDILESATHVCPRCQTKIRLVIDAEQSTVEGNSARSAVVAERREGRPLGKFNILSEVGRGGFGTVYKAIDTELNRVVALKIPRSITFVSATDKRQFLKEAQKAAALEHPGIVPIFDAGETAGIPYIVAKFVEGTTLAEHREVGRLTWRDCARIVIEVADALEYAHEHGLVHRDVKPQNIMIDHSGRPLLMDFGLAKDFHGQVTVTTDGYLKGTPAYMSPEQASGESQHIDRRTDVYALGVILYELLTNELPFGGTPQRVIDQIRTIEPRSPRSLNGRIPLDLETCCQKAMEKEPKRRYQTAGEFADDLRRWTGNLPIAARRIGQFGRTWRWCRRNPAVAGLLVAIGALVLGGVSASLYQNFRIAAANQELRGEISRSCIVRADLENSREIMSALPWSIRALDFAAGDGERQRKGLIRAGMLLERCPQLRQVWQHTGAVTQAVCSADYKLVLTASSDGTVHVWDRATGSPVTPVLTHAAPVRYAEFSSDGGHVVTSTAGSTVHVWEWPSGKLVTTLDLQQPDQEHSVHRVRVRPFQEQFPNQLTLVTGDPDYAIRVWDGLTGRELHGIAQDAPVSDVLLSSNGRHIAVRGINSPKVKLITLADDAAAAWEFKDLAHTANVSAMAFAPDGTALVTAGQDGAVRLWNLEVLGPARNTEFNTDQAIAELAFSGNGTWLAAASANGLVSISSCSKEQGISPPLALAAHPRPVTTIALSQDGEHLATACTDNRVRVWRMVSGGGDELAQLGANILHPQGVNHVEFVRGESSPTLLTGCVDHFARIWQLPEEALPFQLPCESPFRTAETSGDGGLFLVTTKDRRHSAIVCRNGVGGIEIVWTLDVERSGQKDHELSVNCGALGPDGKLVATSTANRTVVVWEVGSGRVVAGPLQLAGQAQHLAFDATGSYVAARTPAGLQVWEVRSGRAVLEAQAAIAQAVFSPRGSMLAVVDHEGVRLHDVGRADRQPSQFSSAGVIGCVFNPDGTRLLTWSEQLAELWNWRASRRLGRSMPIAQGLLGTVFSADGKRLLTWSRDRTAVVWDADAGTSTSTFAQHDQQIAIGALSPDGRLALTVTFDGHGLLWDASSGELLAPPIEHGENVLAAKFSASSSDLLTISVDGRVRRIKILKAGESLAQLRMIAEVLGAQRFDESGSIVALSPQELYERWQMLGAAARP